MWMLTCKAGWKTERTKVNYVKTTYMQKIKSEFRKQIANVIFKNRKGIKIFIKLNQAFLFFLN